MHLTANLNLPTHVLREFLSVYKFYSLGQSLLNILTMTNGFTQIYLLLHLLVAV